MGIATSLFFPNLATPDLGCLVRRKHELKVEPGSANIHVEFVPSIDLNPRFHQTYYRVKCGEAGFFQRALVFMTTDLSIPPPILQHFPPNAILGGDHRPHPSDWQRFPTQSSPRFYWFFGQNRNPATTQWVPDAIVGHTYDIYEHGTLSTVHYDDTGGDQDLNDFIIEVAVVVRRDIELVLETQVKGQDKSNALFTKKRLPQIRAEIAALTKKTKRTGRS